MAERFAGMWYAVASAASRAVLVQWAKVQGVALELEPGHTSMERLTLVYLRWIGAAVLRFTSIGAVLRQDAAEFRFDYLYEAATAAEQALVAGAGLRTRWAVNALGRAPNATHLVTEACWRGRSDDAQISIIIAQVLSGFLRFRTVERKIASYALLDITNQASTSI